MTFVSDIESYEKELTPKQQKYIATYIQRLFLEVNKITDISQMEKLPHHLGMFVNKDDSPLDLMRRIVYQAMSRKDLVCTYDDSNLPEIQAGKCEDENHYDWANDLLTQQENDEFYSIVNSAKGGYAKARAKFEDKLNPPDQELHLMLNYDEDNHKLDPNHGVYVCKKCEMDAAENADGYVECDMDSYER